MVIKGSAVHGSMAIPKGLEPSTFAVTGQRSTLLSYGTINIVWAPPLVGNDKSANHIIVPVIRTTPTTLQRVSNFFDANYWQNTTTISNRVVRLPCFGPRENTEVLKIVLSSTSSLRALQTCVVAPPTLIAYSFTHYKCQCDML